MTASAASGERPENLADLIKPLAVREAPLPDGVDAAESAAGLKFHTNRGEFRGVVHAAPGAAQAVVWVCGARGGFGGPGPGSYSRVAQRLAADGITSLRLDYRLPNDLMECVLDLLVGVGYCREQGCGPVVVVGHSFGGAVVIAAGANSPHIKGVVSLSPQTYGAGMAGQLAPRRLLLAHGKADTRLPYHCAQQIYEWAAEPKELVLYDGAEHRLEKCRDELETLLTQWIPATLAAPFSLE